jgi:hypothetical protein
MFFPVITSIAKSWERHSDLLSIGITGILRSFTRQAFHLPIVEFALS